MHTRFPSSLKKLMCCTVYHWKCGAIKVGVFLEMFVKSPNRFLLNFTLALWTERTRAAHSPSYEADCNLLLYSRIFCAHILKHPLWPGNTGHVPFYMAWIRPWKCSFHVLSELAQSHAVWGIPHPDCIFNGLYLEDFAVFDVKIMVHRIRWLTHITIVRLVLHLHRNLWFTDIAR